MDLDFECGNLLFQRSAEWTPPSPIYLYRNSGFRPVLRHLVGSIWETSETGKLPFQCFSSVFRNQKPCSWYAQDAKTTPKSKGGPTDIEELSAVSTCSPASSCVSSGVSSAASDKLGRVIEQLKKFKLAKTEACPETNPGSSAGCDNKTIHGVSTTEADVKAWRT